MLSVKEPHRLSLSLAGIATVSGSGDRIASEYDTG